MANQILKKKPFPKAYSYLHLGLALLGAVLTIIAALSGGSLLWMNIGLAVLVALLGFSIAFRLFRDYKAKILLLLHGLLATICYLFLLYNTFNNLN